MRGKGAWGGERGAKDKGKCKIKSKNEKKSSSKPRKEIELERLLMSDDGYLKAEQVKQGFSGVNGSPALGPLLPAKRFLGVI